MKTVFHKYNLLWQHLSFWLFTVFFIYFIRFFPHFIEVVYARGIYPVIAVVNRWFFRFFSFSVGDLVYIAGLFYFIFLLFHLLKNIRKPKIYLLQISKFLLQVIWIFYLSWGFNYFREPLSKQLKLPEKNYSFQAFLQVTDTLIARSNRLQWQLTQNDTTAVQLLYGIERIKQKTPAGYRAIASLIDQKYYVPCIKSSLLSKQISYMSVSGYLNPFTGEAQINALYPKIFLPDITSHEVAHQLGYAPEDEANFLGYLASVHHPDPYFNYSGNIDALYYFLIELRKKDEKIYEQKKREIHLGILKNYRKAYEFSQKYKFPIDFSSGYDSYLKLNQQESGIQSYNEMVKLVIAYELSK